MSCDPTQSCSMTLFSSGALINTNLFTQTVLRTIFFYVFVYYLLIYLFINLFIYLFIYLFFIYLYVCQFVFFCIYISFFKGWGMPISVFSMKINKKCNFISKVFSTLIAYTLPRGNNAAVNLGRDMGKEHGEVLQKFTFIFYRQ